MFEFISAGTSLLWTISGLGWTAFCAPASTHVLPILSVDCSAVLSILLSLDTCVAVEDSEASESDEEPSLQHHVCFSMRNCCCGPITLPGLQILSHPMHCGAVSLNVFIIQQAISVPVRPSPALQCTATAPAALSTMSMNFAAISSLGVEPSTKNRSRWSNPASVNLNNESVTIVEIEIWCYD